MRITVNFLQIEVLGSSNARFCLYCRILWKNKLSIDVIGLRCLCACAPIDTVQRVRTVKYSKIDGCY